MSLNLSKSEIFKMVEKRQISAEEAFKLIKQQSTMTASPEISLEFLSNDAQLLQKIQSDLIKAVNQLLRIDVKKISLDNDIREYGFDSISLAGFKDYINKNFGLDIAPYVFFEQPTIGLLAQYFIDEFKEDLMKFYKDALKTASKTPEIGSVTTAVAQEVKKSQVKNDTTKEPQQNGRIQYIDESIWIIDASKKLQTKGFGDFWQDYKAKKIPEIRKSTVSTEYLKSIMKDGYKYLHLLIETSAKKKMEVFVAGTGKPILIVTGVGATATLSYYQIKEWSSKYQVIVFHAPGCGLSDGLADLSLSGIGKAVMEVMEELGVQWPLNAVGGSWGGMLVQTLAKEYPEKMASITLVCSICNPPDKKEEVEMSSTQLNSFNDSIKSDFENTDSTGKHYELYQKSECIDAITLSNYMKFIGPASPAPHTTYEILPEINIPALIITGLKDQVAGNKESQILHSRIKGSQYYEITNAGHFPNLTHSAEFNKKVLEFIGENEITK